MKDRCTWRKSDDCFYLKIEPAKIYFLESENAEILLHLLPFVIFYLFLLGYLLFTLFSQTANVITAGYRPSNTTFSLVIAEIAIYVICFTPISLFFVSLLSCEELWIQGGQVTFRRSIGRFPYYKRRACLQDNSDATIRYMPTIGKVRNADSENLEQIVTISECEIATQKPQGIRLGFWLPKAQQAEIITVLNNFLRH